MSGATKAVYYTILYSFYTIHIFSSILGEGARHNSMIHVEEEEVAGFHRWLCRIRNPVKFHGISLHSVSTCFIQNSLFWYSTTLPSMAATHPNDQPRSIILSPTQPSIPPPLHPNPSIPLMLFRWQQNITVEFSLKNAVEWYINLIITKNG